MNEFERVEASIHKMSDKIETICENIHVISTTLAVNTASLELHMRRTDALEKELKVLERTQNRMLGAFIAAQFLVPILLKFII